MVAGWRHLPGLPPLLSGHERRRHRRPPGIHRPPRLPRRPRRRRRLDLALLPLAHGRLRLRRRRLHRRRPALRHARRLRSPHRSAPRTRPQAHPRLRPQPHLRPAPLVPRKPLLPRQPQARLVPLARPRTRPADRSQQLDVALRRYRPGPSTRHRPVLPPLLSAAAARPQLAQSRGPRRHLRRHALLARRGRRRLPHGRPLAPHQGRPVPRQSAATPTGSPAATPSAASSRSTPPTGPKPTRSSPRCAPCSITLPDERVLIGEIYLPLTRARPLLRLAASPTHDRAASGAELPFNFHLIQTPWDADASPSSSATTRPLLPPGAWPNWVLGNHDQSRLATRIGAAAGPRRRHAAAHPPRHAHALLRRRARHARRHHPTRPGAGSRRKEPARHRHGPRPRTHPHALGHHPQRRLHRRHTVASPLPERPDRLRRLRQLTAPRSVLALYRRAARPPPRSTPRSTQGDIKRGSRRKRCPLLQRVSGDRRLHDPPEPHRRSPPDRHPRPVASSSPPSSTAPAPSVGGAASPSRRTKASSSSSADA